MEWRPAGWSVSASVNLPLHHKVQKFSSGTGSPGWSRKKVVKQLCWCGGVHTQTVVETLNPAACGRRLSSEVLAWLSVWSEVQMICMWSS